MPPDLSHSHSQLLGLQLNPLSQTILSTKSSPDSHLHLSSFYICLLLQTATLNLHTHLQVSCHNICLISLIIDIRLNTSTFIFFNSVRNAQFSIWIIDIITISSAFIYFNTVRIEHRLIIVNIYYFWSCFTFLIFH